MKIFVSWSGRVARTVGDALQAFVFRLLPDCELWVSTHGVRAGSDWRVKIASEIDASRLGILCLTKRRLFSPWLDFEAGALWKSDSTTRVIPYLIDLAEDELIDPVKSFQALRADRAGTLELVQTIAAAMSEEGAKPDLVREFPRFWPAFERRLQRALLEGEPEGLRLAGDWTYRCAPHGVGAEWGGACEIVEEETWDSRFGWKLYGERRWIAEIDHLGKPKKKELPTPFSWVSDWMGMTGKRSLKFTYSIATPEGNIEGYAFGDVFDVDGRPARIQGKFFHLPPYKPVHGEMVFKRKVVSRRPGKTPRKAR